MTSSATDPTIAHRICPICEACCGLELKLAGGRVTSIRGHDADVFSGGYLCPKGTALKDLHEDPDRLRTPLVKRGGRFVEVSWEDAFAESFPGKPFRDVTELSHDELAAKWNVMAVIAKPFSPRELLQKVDGVLGERNVAKPQAAC